MNQPSNTKHEEYHMKKFNLAALTLLLPICFLHIDSNSQETETVHSNEEYQAVKQTIAPSRG